MIKKTDTVMLWLEELKQGNRETVRMMLERYLHRLIALAEKRLRRLPHLVGYGEDVALSAVKSPCLGVGLRYSWSLRDCFGLWTAI